jgi:hypothetical protein
VSIWKIVPVDVDPIIEPSVYGELDSAQSLVRRREMPFDDRWYDVLADLKSAFLRHTSENSQSSKVELDKRIADFNRFVEVNKAVLRSRTTAVELIDRWNTFTDAVLLGGNQSTAFESLLDAVDDEMAATYRSATGKSANATPWTRLCETLSKVSSEVHEWSKAQPNVGEESLTDRILYQVSSELSFVRYHKFSRAEESRQSGADWDWWFVDGQNALGLRIQAKRLRANKDHYPSIAHASRSGLQIDRLRTSAVASGLVALYSMYSSRPAHHCQQVAPRDEGILLAGATSVFDSVIAPGRRHVSGDELAELTNPLACVACCPLAFQQNSVKGVHAHLVHYFPSEFAADPSIGLHGQLPQFAAALLASHPREPNPEVEEEASRAVSGETGAVLIVDLRQRG